MEKGTARNEFCVFPCRILLCATGLTRAQSVYERLRLSSRTLTKHAPVGMCSAELGDLSDSSVPAHRACPMGAG